MKMPTRQGRVYVMGNTRSEESKFKKVTRKSFRQWKESDDWVALAFFVCFWAVAFAGPLAGHTVHLLLLMPIIVLIAKIVSRRAKSDLENITTGRAMRRAQIGRQVKT